MRKNSYNEDVFYIFFLETMVLETAPENNSDINDIEASILETSKKGFPVDKKPVDNKGQKSGGEWKTDKDKWTTAKTEWKWWGLTNKDIEEWKMPKVIRTGESNDKKLTTEEIQYEKDMIAYKEIVDKNPPSADTKKKIENLNGDVNLKLTAWEAIAGLAYAAITPFQKPKNNEKKIPAREETYAAKAWGLTILPWTLNWTLPDSLIGKFKNLSSLNISGIGISKFPEITKLKNLNQLDLKNNSITNIPDYITDLKDIRNINLNWNNIVRLPYGMSNLKKLYNLDIQNNKNLLFLPPDIWMFDNLKINAKWSPVEAVITALEKIQINEANSITKKTWLIREMWIYAMKPQHEMNLTQYKFSEEDKSVAYKIEDLKSLAVTYKNAYNKARTPNKVA